MGKQHRSASVLPPEFRSLLGDIFGDLNILGDDDDSDDDDEDCPCGDRDEDGKCTCPDSDEDTRHCRRAASHASTACYPPSSQLKFSPILGSV